MQNPFTAASNLGVRSDSENCQLETKNLVQFLYTTNESRYLHLTQSCIPDRLQWCLGTQPACSQAYVDVLIVMNRPGLTDSVWGPRQNKFRRPTD